MKTQHEILIEDTEFRRLLAIETLVAEASETIARLMAEQKVSKADLARKLNKSRAWVTQLLSGRANITVRTLAEVVYALDAEVKINSQPQNWKRAARVPGAASPPVVYKMQDKYVGSPVAAETMFRLQSDLMSTGDELASVDPGDPDRSEYAA